MIRLSTMMLVLVALAGTVPSVSQTPTFSIKTEEVHINVLVTENGKPVRGLIADDFEVRDCGVRQTIEYVSLEQNPVSVTLVLDMSNSVAGALLQNLKAAGNELLGRLRKGDRAALITFNQTVRLDAASTSNIGQVKTALDQARTQSPRAADTSLIDASFTGLINAESKTDLPLVVVFTDGMDTSSWLTQEEVVEAAKRGDAVVYAVSAGRLPGRAFLRDLTEATGGTAFEVESMNDLGRVFASIIEEFRVRYLLTYSPAGVSKSGWHPLAIRVNRRNVKITARTGYSIRN
jgi:VWFA-related protein